MLSMNKAKYWWKSRTPEQKQKVKYIGLALMVLFIAILSVSLGKQNLVHHNAVKKSDESTTNFNNRLQNMSHMDQGAQIHKLRQQIDRLQAILASQNNLSTAQLKAEEKKLSTHMIAEMRKHPIQLEGIEKAQAQQESPKVAQEIASLQQQLQQNQSELAAVSAARNAQPAYTPPSAPPAPSSASGIQIMTGNGMSQNGTAPTGSQVSTVFGKQTAPPSAPAHLMTLSTSGRKLKNNIVKVSSKKEIYLPAGTIITGVTLNGLDASTGPGSRNNPEITDIRVKKIAILPNGYRSSVKNCEIIASGYGSLVSKRVYMRTNALSCVAPNGGVISAPIKGYVVGSDGIVGVRGTEISYQGPRLFKSMIAGLFSGLGAAAQPQTVMGLNMQPGATQQFQMANPGYMASSALSGGINTSAGQVSQFYLREAEQMQPTIQINPGVSVSIILEYGSQVSLKGNTKRQIQKTNYAVSQALNQQGSNNMPQNSGEVQGSMPPFGQQSPMPSTQMPYNQTQPYNQPMTGGYPGGGMAQAPSYPYGG